MSNNKLIHLIADYGKGDLAFAEVFQRLQGLNPDDVILPTSVPAFSTLATGFVISQLALNDPIENMTIYSNTAPRKDDTEKRHENVGEPFVYAILENGIVVCGVHAQYAFSFIKPHIKKFGMVNVENRGSQFRSRDFYPAGATAVFNDDKKAFGDKLDLKHIPEIPKNKIMYADGYGNIKTTIRSSKVTFKPGEKIRINIGGHIRTGVYADANFEVKSGDLAFAPGSSGGSDRFMEIFLRGSSAHKMFFKPMVESDISLERFED
ncbi:hypothetical protein ACFL1M_00430 [Patescibacteria group bacterium]